MSDLDKYMSAALDLAHEAGKVLHSGRGLRKVNDDAGKDVKLQADVESEKLIRKGLGERTGLPVIGEELGGDPSLLERDEPFWVVDPLDGTYNYLRDMPICCVSIALMQGTEPLLGVIHDFYRNETLCGGPNLGLKLNGKELEPDWASDISQATLQTGFTTAQDYSDESIRKMLEHVRLFKKTRAIGSAAIALAWVAAGRSDVYHETSIRLWDIAAGVALIKAGGGSVRMRQLDKPAFAYDVWAGCEAFFPEG